MPLALIHGEDGAIGETADCRLAGEPRPYKSRERFWIYGNFRGSEHCRDCVWPVRVLKLNV